MKIAKHLIEQIDRNLSNIERDEYHSLQIFINNYKRIFIIGSGRSLLIGKMFAMRLMHLDKKVYIVDDVTCPSLRKGDLLIVISGSGNTQYINKRVEKAREEGIHIFTITQNVKSFLTEISDNILYIPKKEIDIDKPIPLGTSFELSSLLLLENIIADIMETYNIPEEELSKNHINI